MATYASVQLHPSPGDGAVAAMPGDQDWVGTGDPEDDRRQREYLHRARSYLDRVKPQRPAGDLPSVWFSHDGSAEYVVVDENLDARLMQIYVLHGWEGVQRVGGLIDQNLAIRRPDDGAGWPEAVWFYRYVRLRLRQRLRRALANVFQRASERALLEFSLGAAGFAKLVPLLGLKRGDSPRAPGSDGARGGSGRDSDQKLVVAHRDMTTKLYHILHEFMVRKELLAQARQRLQALEQAAERAGRLARQAGEDLSAGVLLPEERAGGRHQREADAAERDVLQQQETAALYAAMFKRVAEAVGNVSFGLFNVVPLLNPAFNLDQFEEALVAGLQVCIGHLETTAAGLGGSEDWIDAGLADAEADETSESLQSVESWCVDAAMKDAETHLNRLPMLSELLLNRMISAGVLPIGSLEHIVAVHYLAELARGLEAARAADEARRSVADACAKLSAALSLAAMFSASSPQTAGAAPVLEGFSLAFGMPVLLYEAYSIFHQISRFDLAIRQRMIDAGVGDMEASMQVGELLLMREEYPLQVTATLVVELAMARVGGKWVATKRALLFRSYTMDLLTLVED